MTVSDSYAWKPEVYIALFAFFLSLVALGVTIYYSYKSAKYQRLSTSATLLTTFITKYDSVEMMRARKAFAAKLIDKDAREKIDLGEDSEPVMELFEEIGYLARTEVLDKGMVWNHFFWFIERYYIAVTVPTNLIYKTREDQESPTIYQEIEWMFNVLGRYDKGQSGSKVYIEPNGDQVKKFLTTESKLSV